VTDEAATPAPLPDIPRDETGQSSIKLTRNAAGNVQIEVKVYATANDETSVGEAEALAVGIMERQINKWPMVRK